MDTNPFAPPTAAVTDILPLEADSTLTPFFPISVTKLLVLTVCTLGLYQVFWFYKNWKLIKERESSDIYPIPRAIFSILYCYPCFKKIRDFDAIRSTGTNLAAGRLAAGWIITSLLQKLPDSYWFISLFAVLFLVPVQIYANQVNAAHSPNHNPNRHFSAWNWVAIVLGSIVLVLAAIGSMVPATK